MGNSDYASICLLLKSRGSGHASWGSPYAFSSNNTLAKLATFISLIILTKEKMTNLSLKLEEAISVKHYNLIFLHAQPAKVTVIKAW